MDEGGIYKGNVRSCKIH